ncbi:MAG: dihydroorotase [Clostridiales bacterium]|nr:dihydroorotase [Clostridiales bacterium]
MKLLIKNGRILDPSSGLDSVEDLLVEDEFIVKVEKDMKITADEIIDASGFFVMPGLIDLHVHLREPGFEHKETIKTGTLAAARGGFTTICPMPNTQPVTDNAGVVKFVLDKAAEEGIVNVLPVGAITIGQNGKELADITAMAKSGAVAISEDGKTVMNLPLYKEAMISAARNNLVVMAHCEDHDLAPGGVINAGEKATQLNVKGISNEVEDSIVERDILLARETGAKLHLCHCSTKGSVLLTKAAKEKKIPVTAEVCPHHFTLTDADIIGDDSNYKMNPPLRSKEDVIALKEGLRDGIIDVISTDHAPHHSDEKAQSIKDAPFGIVGLETAVPLTITELVNTGYLTPLEMAEKMSTNPAKILGIDKGSLKPGKIADITIIDPNVTYNIDVNSFLSKGKNTPFHGRPVKGKVMATIVSGKVVFIQ